MATTATDAFQWSEDRLVCVATYNILEGDNFLDQFEDADIPFKKAASVKLGTLRYFPKTTGNPQIIELLGIEISRKFVAHLVKTFTVKKQLPKSTSAQILSAIAAVFQNKDKTIIDLAMVVDAQIQFPDEV